MKSKWIQNLLAAVLVGSFINGCESIVQVDLPPHAPSLVAHGVFSPDDGWVVFLSHSVGALSNDFPKPVENGTVEIWTEGERIATLGHQQFGIYRANTPRPLPQKEYTLRAVAPGFSEITGSGHLPQPVPIEAVQTEVINGDFGIRTVNLTVRLQDPGSDKNFYELFILGRRPDGNFNILFMRSKDLAITQSNASDIDPGDEPEFRGHSALFEDALFNGDSYDLKVSAELYENERSLTVVLSNVSEAVFRHVKTAELQAENDENPFAEPAQIFQNIQNGYGVFGGYNSSRFPVNVP